VLSDNAPVGFVNEINWFCSLHKHWKSWLTSKTARTKHRAPRWRGSPRWDDPAPEGFSLPVDHRRI